MPLRELQLVSSKSWQVCADAGSGTKPRATSSEDTVVPGGVRVVTPVYASRSALSFATVRLVSTIIEHRLKVREIG
jgi:hypothetical protein